MTLVVRPYEKEDYARALEICIAAFEPIHKGFEQALGSRIFKLQYRDWKEQYADTLRKISKRDRYTKVHVVEFNGVVAGFVFTNLDAKRRTGEIGLNAVDPNLHGRGIGTALMRLLIDYARADGLERLEGMVLSENHGMLGLIARLGFTIAPDPEPGVVMSRLKL